MATNPTDPRKRLEDLYAQQEAEQARIKQVTSNLQDILLRKYRLETEQDAHRTKTDLAKLLGIDPSEALYCATEACESLREAGYTLPGGLEWPIIPSNYRFARQADRLPLELIRPDESGNVSVRPGDILQWIEVEHGSSRRPYHMTLVGPSGSEDDNRLYQYYSPGDPDEYNRHPIRRGGVSEGGYNVWRYVGDLPGINSNIQSTIDEAKALPKEEPVAPLPTLQPKPIQQQYGYRPVFAPKFYSDKVPKYQPGTLPGRTLAEPERQEWQNSLLGWVQNAYKGDFQAAMNDLRTNPWKTPYASQAADVLDWAQTIGSGKIENPSQFSPPDPTSIGNAYLAEAYEALHGRPFDPLNPLFGQSPTGSYTGGQRTLSEVTGTSGVPGFLLDMVDPSMLIPGANLAKAGVKSLANIAEQAVRNPSKFIPEKGISTSVTPEVNVLGASPGSTPGAPYPTSSTTHPRRHEKLFLEYQAQRVKELSSPEGRRRLQAVMDANPKIKARYQNNVDKYIEETQNVKFDPYANTIEFIDDDGTRILKHIPKNPNTSFLQGAGGDEAFKMWLGNNFSEYDALHQAAHELDHTVQGLAYPRAGIDDTLKELTPKKNIRIRADIQSKEDEIARLEEMMDRQQQATGVPAGDYFQELLAQMKDDVATARTYLDPPTQQGDVPKVDDTQFSHAGGFRTTNPEEFDAEAHNYFMTGSEGAEPGPFATEIRENLLQRGYIQNRHDQITPEILQKHYEEYQGITGNKYPLRIYDFMENTPGNFGLLSEVINKIPAVVGTVGAGAAAVQGTQSPETQRYGSVPKYQKGTDPKEKPGPPAGINRQFTVADSKTKRLYGKEREETRKQIAQDVIGGPLGLLGMGALAPTIPAIVGAAPAVAAGLAAPAVVGSTTLPWLTTGNVVTALGVSDFIKNRAPEIPNQIARGEYGAAAENALTGALDIAGTGAGAALWAPAIVNKVKIPGLSLGNLATSFGVADYIVNRAPEIVDQVSRGEYGAAGENALTGAIDFSGLPAKPTVPKHQDGTLPTQAQLDSAAQVTANQLGDALNASYSTMAERRRQELKDYYDNTLVPYYINEGLGVQEAKDEANKYLYTNHPETFFELFPEAQAEQDLGPLQSLYGPILDKYMPSTEMGTGLNYYDFTETHLTPKGILGLPQTLLKAAKETRGDYGDPLEQDLVSLYTTGRTNYRTLRPTTTPEGTKAFGLAPELEPEIEEEALNVLVPEDPTTSVKWEQNPFNPYQYFIKTEYVPFGAFRLVYDTRDNTYSYRDVYDLDQVPMVDRVFQPYDIYGKFKARQPVLPQVNVTAPRKKSKRK